MISIIVYGRNDERGYGMHKRVAMSLNAMAHALSAPLSEILFVDYNTPDHLPTLPELICDVLTDAARVRTRVLRVRPSVHARFAPLTPLPVLEPIARNIALRRSRPQNQWILSSNTDCIFATPDGRSLCEIAAELPGSHYGAPRFEIPERIWETFNRMDPAGLIAAADGWGKHARLREAVRGEGVVQFDAPGDCQLVRRADLFAIDGFDEEALLGWHIDYNLAHRMNILRGREGDLSSLVRLYHCGHARRATQTHNADRIENDLARLVHNVRDPDIPAQRDSWGCIDDDIEEIDLCRAPGADLLRAVEAVMAPLPPARLSGYYNAKSFNSLAYDAGHVVTHVLDLLSTFPRGALIGYAGCRRDVLQALVRGLKTLGFERRLAVPDLLVERLTVGAAPEVEAVSLGALNAASVVLFEFGLVRDETGDARDPLEPVRRTHEEEQALANVAHVYSAFVEREREDMDAAVGERLVVTIGALHSQFEPMIDATLAATPSPFTTRLRFGPVRAEASRNRVETRQARPAVWTADRSAARAALTRLMRGGELGDDRLDVVASSRLIRQMILDDEIAAPDGVSREALLDRLEDACRVPSELSRLPVRSHETSGPSRPYSALARLSDWDDPVWLASARQVARSGQRGAAPRNGWVWQRAQLLHVLSHLLEGRQDAKALMVMEHPDTFVSDAGRLFGTVHLADVRDIFPGDDKRLTHASTFAGGAFLPESRYQVVDLSSLREPYDVIVLPHSAAFRDTVVGLGRLIAQLRPFLAPDGVVALAGEVALLGGSRKDRPDLEAGCRSLPRVMQSSAGLAQLGQLDAEFDPLELALCGTGEDLAFGRPVIGLRQANDVLWPVVWIFEAAGGDVSSIPGSSLERAMAGLMLGEQLPVLSLTQRAERRDGQIVGRTDEGAGHVFFGPFLSLPPGDYVARIEVSCGHPDVLVAEISRGSDIIAQRDVAISAGSPGVAVIPFSVAEPPAGGLSEGHEIRLWSRGEYETFVTSVRLEAV